MGIALLLSFAFIGLDKLGFSSLHEAETALWASINFSDLLMQGMLSVLLFAGALHVDLSELSRYRIPVALLSVLGTVTSTLLVGFGLSAVRDGGGGAPHRQARSGASDVGHQPRIPRHVLGIARRHPELGALRADRTGGRGRSSAATGWPRRSFPTARRSARPPPWPATAGRRPSSVPLSSFCPSPCPRPPSSSLRADGVHGPAVVSAQRGAGAAAFAACGR